MGKPRTYISMAFLQAMILVLAFFSTTSAAIDEIYSEKLDILREQLLERGFDENYVESLFADERIALYPAITTRTGKGFNYLNRRFGLLTQPSVERGRNILKQKKRFFDEIETEFGVSREIVVSIMRIETNFGRSTGSRPIFNSLLTLALVENRRSEWAMEEMAHLLRLCSENNVDPLTINGSWAGAFGLAQFIPSSYVKYAVDGDGDGSVDLFRFNDAASSIANYLKLHGWEGQQREKHREAIWSYNHCDSYVKAVFAYAAALKRQPVPARNARLYTKNSKRR